MSRISVRDYWRMGRVRGWRYPFRYFRQSHAFDLLRGTDTHFWIPPIDHAASFNGPTDAVHYVACPTRSVRAALQAVEAFARERFQQLQFFDLGCGKGKALLVYAEHTAGRDVRQAIGVEVMPTLARIAEANVRICNLEARIRIVSGDAGDWLDLCQSSAALLFLYNPFGSGTLERVLARAKGLECYVAYIDPEHSAVLENRGWVKLYSSLGKYRNDRIEIWHSGEQSTCRLTDSNHS